MIDLGTPLQLLDLNFDESKVNDIVLLHNECKSVLSFS